VIVATGGNIAPVVQVFPSDSTAKLLTMVVPSTGSAATAFWLKLKVQDIVSTPFNNEIVCLFLTFLNNNNNNNNNFINVSKGATEGESPLY